MRTSLLASLALGALSVPALSLAAFTSPSSVLMALQLQNKPIDFAYEAHVNGPLMDEATRLYVSAWMKGAAQGSTMTDTKADAAMTVDVAFPDGTVRVKTHMRVLNGTAYMFLDSVTGNYEQDVVKAFAEISGKKWFSFPLKNAEMEEGMDDAAAKMMVMKTLDALLSIEKTNATTYSLSLRPDAAEQLHALQEDPSLTTSPILMDDLASLREQLAAMNIHATLTTDGNDWVKGIKFYVSAKDTSSDATFVSQGTMTVRSNALTVTVPENVMDLEQQLQSLGSPFGLPFEDNSWSSEEETPWEESSSDWSSSEPSWDELVGCGSDSAGVMARRRGECDTAKPTRRSIREMKQQSNSSSMSSSSVGF